MKFMDFILGPIAWDIMGIPLEEQDRVLPASFLVMGFIPLLFPAAWILDKMGVEINSRS